MKTTLGLALLLLTAAGVSGQERRAPDPRSMGGGDCRDNVYNCADTPNPLPAASSVWMEEMTWMDVRDALAAGKKTVIVPTGGMEPNGPWLVTGKHNYVLRANCDALARELGDAMCAPIVKWVPEGSYDPPTSHMASPGTISLREETFQAMLTDVARSLKAHGFSNIIFIGDSGGNQGGQRAVAEKLTAEWHGNPVVAHVQEYYDYAGVERHMEGRGLVSGASDNLHDDPVITLNMFYTDPNSVRYDGRVAANLASINGVSIADRARSLELAREIVAFRARSTSEAVHKAIQNKGTLPAPERQAGGGFQGQRGERPAPDPRTMGGGDCRQSDYNCSDARNPLPAPNTVWLEEMTWMDVRDALAAGKTTAIISTGGMEPNGPWLVTGKHNYVLHANCDAIARQLGNAICAPVIPLVPEGSYDPPSGHMSSPGTISLQEKTFEALLTDVAQSLKTHGFENIVFIGDSGGNQTGMKNVAGQLTAAWHGSAHAHFIPEYYDYASVSRYMETRGLLEGESDNMHDDPVITLNMFYDDPSSVRYFERLNTRQAAINGFSIADRRKAEALAQEIVNFRATQTAGYIQRAIAGATQQR